MTWLDPVRRRLDEAESPIRFFFRDDDAGWADLRLARLVALFRECSLPLDLAVIPAALTPGLATTLCRWARERAVALHQHGFAHKSHQSSGRKCEFGSSRVASAQTRDIAAGRARLDELLGDLHEPIFTPPWNRCVDATGAALERLGFEILSRDDTAPPLERAGLAEVPVTVDWFARRKGVRLGRSDLGEWIARKATKGAPVGIMFHHAVMDDRERDDAADLLALLAAHANADCRFLRACVEAQR